MYSRFYRWASDRIAENGIIAFITNRSFIDSRTFDRFRKQVAEEFDYVYIVDTAFSTSIWDKMGTVSKVG